MRQVSPSFPSQAVWHCSVSVHRPCFSAVADLRGHKSRIDCRPDHLFMKSPGTLRGFWIGSMVGSSESSRYLNQCQPTQFGTSLSKLEVKVYAGSASGLNGSSLSEKCLINQESLAKGPACSLAYIWQNSGHSGSNTGNAAFKKGEQVDSGDLLVKLTVEWAPESRV